MPNLELSIAPPVSCCPPLGSEPLSAEQAEKLARGFQAVSNPVRLRLLALLAARVGEAACVCDLTSDFELSGPTMSHHFKVLREAGLITGERRGTWVYYRVVPEAMHRLSTVLDSGADTP
ncbi:ArsR/SmtB family transcription factor [Amycolatopsis nigrescens]|uniref:ArsR/SmtB family transcription factor n=1 Tax=Amycolatopsis nigrescens TaxID=381445 RepID=UPI00037D5126|nr:metalloregulator ArsR/SmtB family transcription factor [Amycolatopsis nigrescens]